MRTEKKNIKILWRRFKNFFKKPLVRRFWRIRLWFHEQWEDTWRALEEWEFEAGEPAATEDDYYLLIKARYYYDKFTNHYFFSHWSEHEDNYEYYADMSISDNLSDEDSDIEVKKLPFSEYYMSYVRQCEQHKAAFLQEFKIECPWDFIDDHENDAVHEPQFISSPLWHPHDLPQHNHEHEWVHTYFEEDAYQTTKLDLEEPEGLLQGHEYREEYDWSFECPSWLNPIYDLLFYDHLRALWTSYEARCEKVGVGYNLDLIVNYCLKDYYGFLSFDDDFNISIHLARRLRYHDNPICFIPSDVFAQNHLDEIIDLLIIDGVLADYFDDWAAPTNQEVALARQVRRFGFWARFWNNTKNRISRFFSNIKLSYLRTKLRIVKRFIFIKRYFGGWYQLGFIGSIKRSIYWFIQTITWYTIRLLMLLWGLFISTVICYIFATYLSQWHNEGIISVKMVGEEEEAVGPMWIYLGALLHIWLAGYFAMQSGRSFIILSAYERLRQVSMDELVEYELVELEKVKASGGYMKYRRSHGFYAQEKWTSWLHWTLWTYMIVFLLVLVVFDVQSEFHHYLEDWLHIQVAIYDWPIVNGDLPLDENYIW